MIRKKDRAAKLLRTARKPPICPICPIFPRGGRWCGEARGLAAVEVGFKQRTLAAVGARVRQHREQAQGDHPRDHDRGGDPHPGGDPARAHDHDHKRGENCVVGLEDSNLHAMIERVKRGVYRLRDPDAGAG